MAAPAKALSARDKEKLKEKLASLQREYRKTFRRLQRAERAERVKSYVKKTVAEQNRLLLQGVAEEEPAGSISQMAPEATKSIPAGSFSKMNTVKTPSVTFSFETEVFSQEGLLPESSGSERTDREHESCLGPARPVPEKKQSRLSRSRRRGQLTMSSEGRRATARQGDQPGDPPEGPQSPVFMRQGSDFKLDPSILQMPSAVTAKQGGTNATPVTPQPEGLKGLLAENDPSLLCPLLGNPLEESWSSSLEKLGKDGIFTTSESSVAKATVLRTNIQNVAKEKEDEQDLSGTSYETRSKTCQNRSSSGVLRSSGCRNSNSPAFKMGKKSFGGDAEAGSPFREDVSPATPNNSLLGSCTVVEGLLFPVEYYVRTTRQMSSCQREPNLAAVIQSQLGTRRKSHRVSLKERAVNPALSSQGLAARGELPTPPDASQEGGSGSKESTAPGDGPPQSGGLTQRRRRGRRKGRGRPRRRAAGRVAQGPLALAGLEGNGSLASSGGCPPEAQQQAENQSRAGVELAQTDTISSHQIEPSGSSPKCKAERTSPGRTGGRRCRGAPDPASLGCLGVPGGGDLAILKWLPSDSNLQEFHLPEDEFGLLQSEKVRASAVKPLESVEAAEPARQLHGADVANRQAAEDSLDDGLFSPEDEPPEASRGPRDLHTSKLLLSPGNAGPEGGSGQAESQVPTPLFPVVGATPATPDVCDTSQQVPATVPREPGPLAAALGPRGCDKAEERCPVGARLTGDKGRGSQKPEEAAMSTEERRGPAATSREHYRAPANQTEEVAEDSVQLLEDRQGKGNLWMTSKLKNYSGSCSVDVSAVWWETAGFTELCVVTACETSVALWRHLDPGGWEKVHTWSFVEVPVFQIVPLPGAHSLVCVALGSLEIVEVRLLSQSLEDACLKQSLVKAGNIKAVLGLSGRRLVSSCDRAVEVLSFPEAGGCGTRRALFPPEETTLAFAAVDGMAEALVGLTAANCVVVWNLATGQLLSRMPLGYAYPAPVCHQAYSDSGLLFVVFSHPHAKDTWESRGSPAFQVVVFNPKTARSCEVMVMSLPPRTQGRQVESLAKRHWNRYLEGDVREASAAAVLTSGAIAVWDLSGGACTALLHPPAEGRWSLVRWSVSDKCLLAAQMDGSVCIFTYMAWPPSVSETVTAGRTDGSAWA